MKDIDCYIYVSIYRGADGYGVAIDVEVAGGTVIDLWGEYASPEYLVETLSNNLERAFRLLNRIHGLKASKILIRVGSDIHDASPNLRKLEDLLNAIIEGTLGEVDWRLEYVDDIVYKRVYSLAKKAYEVRGLYPPKKYSPLS